MPGLHPFIRLVALSLAATVGLGGTSVLHATSVVPPAFAELVNQSDYVVRARVAAVAAAWQDRGQGRVIVSHVTLEVREVIAGQPPTPLVLEVMGGRVGEQEMVVAGAPRWSVGDEDILFIQANGRQIVPLTGLMHGLYRVVRDAKTGRDYVTRHNGRPLLDASEVSQPMAAESASPAAAALQAGQALSPAAFGKRVRAARREPEAAGRASVN